MFKSKKDWILSLDATISVFFGFWKQKSLRIFTYSFSSDARKKNHGLFLIVFNDNLLFLMRIGKRFRFYIPVNTLFNEVMWNNTHKTRNSFIFLFVFLQMEQKTLYFYSGMCQAVHIIFLIFFYHSKHSDRDTQLSTFYPNIWLEYCCCECYWNLSTTITTQVTFLQYFRAIY